MNNPEKNELLSELWREAGAPVRESALGGMIAEGRRRRARRRTAQAAIVAAAVIAGGLCIWPRKETPGPQASAPVAPQVAAPSQTTAVVQDRKPLQLVEIHHLTPARNGRATPATQGIRVRAGRHARRAKDGAAGEDRKVERFTDGARRRVIRAGLCRPSGRRRRRWECPVPDLPHRPSRRRILAAPPARTR